MISRAGAQRVALKVGLYIFFFVLFLFLFVFIRIGALLGTLAEAVLGTLIPTLLANIITLRIYEALKLSDIGLPWNAHAAWNVAWGVAGGILSASLVLAAPIAVRAAVLESAPLNDTSWRVFLFLPVMLFLGAAGEELLFRGYGFQVLLRAAGPFTTILPVGVLFAALHASNPHVTTLGLINTAGFGMLFGYAFVRSHDIWLPIGLHFGWNVTLPLFGVSVSGITMRLTGYRLQWNAGPLWSGGEYGPEASILTSVVLFALFLFVWKAPVRRQRNLLLDEPVES